MRGVVFGVLLLSVVTMQSLLLVASHSIRTQFILTETHHPGNVGAAARALKTMGFGELILVNPHDPKVLHRKKTKDGASGALDVLEKTAVFESLSDAVKDIDCVCATGMPFDMHQIRTPKLYVEPRPYFQQILSQDDHDDRTRTNKISSIAFVFGNERYGMLEEDFELCQIVLGIPTNPMFGSLNLASAVQLIAYDWRQALGGFASPDVDLETTSSSSENDHHLKKNGAKEGRVMTNAFTTVQN